MIFTKTYRTGLTQDICKLLFRSSLKHAKLGARLGDPSFSAGTVVLRKFCRIIILFLFLYLYVAKSAIASAYPYGCSYSNNNYKTSINGYEFLCYKDCYCHSGGDINLGNVGGSFKCLEQVLNQGAIGANIGNNSCHLKTDCNDFRNNSNGHAPYCLKVSNSPVVENSNIVVNPWLEARSSLDFEKGRALYDVKKVVEYIKQMQSGVSKCKMDNWDEGLNVAKNELSDFFTGRWGDLGDRIDCGYGYKQYATYCYSRCNMIKTLYTPPNSKTPILQPLRECAVGGALTPSSTCGIDSNVCKADILGKTFSVVGVIASAITSGQGGGLTGALMQLGISGAARQKEVQEALSWTGIPNKYIPIAAMVPFSANLLEGIGSALNLNIGGVVSSIDPHLLYNSSFSAIEEGCKLGMKNDKVMSENKANYTCKAISLGFKMVVDSVLGGANSGATVGTSVLRQMPRNVLKELTRLTIIESVKYGIGAAEAELCTDSLLSGDQTLYCKVGMNVAKFAVDYAALVQNNIKQDEVNLQLDFINFFKSGVTSATDISKIINNNLIQNLYDTTQNYYKDRFTISQTLTEEQIYNINNKLGLYIQSKNFISKNNSLNSVSLYKGLYNDNSKINCQNSSDIRQIGSDCRLYITSVSENVAQQISNDLTIPEVLSSISNIRMGDLISVGMTIDDAAECFTKLNKLSSYESASSACKVAVKAINNEEVYKKLSSATSYIGIINNGGIVTEYDSDGLTRANLALCDQAMIPMLIKFYAEFNPNNVELIRDIVLDKAVCKEFIYMLNESVSNPGARRNSLNDFMALIVEKTFNNPNFANYIKAKEYTSTIIQSIQGFRKGAIYNHLMEILPNYIKWKNPGLSNDLASKYADVLSHAAYLELAKEAVSLQEKNKEADDFYKDPAFYDKQLDPTGIQAVLDSYSDTECKTLRHVGQLAPTNAMINNYYQKLNSLLIKELIKTGEIIKEGETYLTLYNHKNEAQISSHYLIGCDYDSNFLYCTDYGSPNGDSCLEYKWDINNFNKIDISNSPINSSTGLQKERLCRNMYAKVLARPLVRTMYRVPATDRFNNFKENTILTPGDFYCSSNRKFWLKMEKNGDLAIYNAGGGVKKIYSMEQNMVPLLYNTTPDTYYGDNRIVRAATSPFSFVQDVRGDCGGSNYDLTYSYTTFDECKLKCEDDANCTGISVKLKKCDISSNCSGKYMIPVSSSTGVQIPTECYLKKEMAACNNWTDNEYSYFEKSPYNKDIINNVAIGFVIDENDEHAKRLGIVANNISMLDSGGNLRIIRKPDKKYGFFLNNYNYSYPSDKYNHTLRMQSDGNLVLYAESNPYWATGTNQTNMPSAYYMFCPYPKLHIEENTGQGDRYELYMGDIKLGSSDQMIGCDNDIASLNTTCYKASNDNTKYYYLKTNVFWSFNSSIEWLEYNMSNLSSDLAKFKFYQEALLPEVRRSKNSTGNIFARTINNGVALYSSFDNKELGHAEVAIGCDITINNKINCTAINTNDCWKATFSSYDHSFINDWTQAFECGANSTEEANNIYSSFSNNIRIATDSFLQSSVNNDLLSNLAVFDLELYKALNQDLNFSNDQDYITHWLNYGINEKRPHSLVFDLNFYKTSNQDLANFSNMEVINHWLKNGIEEGRHGSPVFDIKFYKNTNPDLANYNNLGLINHWINSGLSEGRISSAIFDVMLYKNLNPDLSNYSYKQLVYHWYKNGISERRLSSSLFNLTYYKDLNPDLANYTDMELISHWLSVGVNEGRHSSPVFNVKFYKLVNPDVSNFSNDELLAHWVLNGISEDRIGSPFFNLKFYRSANSDLSNYNNQVLIQHWMKDGLNEARMASPVFDINFYKIANPDLNNLTNFALIEHWLTTGISEQYGNYGTRLHSAVFDLKFYKDTNPDLNNFSNLELLAHWLVNGMFESNSNYGSRFHSPVFDLKFYQNTNSDLGSYNKVDLIVHWLTTGMSESVNEYGGRPHSPVFDINFYKTANPDLAKLTNMELISHWLTNGMHEIDGENSSRLHSILFDIKYYKDTNTDLNNLNSIDLIKHWLLLGMNEQYGDYGNRLHSPVFDINFYKSVNEDLANFSNIDALIHWISNGIPEGRLGTQVFDLLFYRETNPDLNDFTNTDLIKHWLIFGMNDSYGAYGSRFHSPVFDVKFYKSTNPDLSQLKNIDLIKHWLTFGMKESSDLYGMRLHSPFFFIKFYRDANADIANYSNNDLIKHWVLRGITEGRIASPLFNIQYYISNNSDLNFDNNIKYFTHWLKYGITENREHSLVFNSNFYIKSNQDLSFTSPMDYAIHWFNYGINEGRPHHPNFNLAFYKNNYSDLQFPYPLDYAVHWLLYGIQEGRSGVSE